MTRRPPNIISVPDVDDMAVLVVSVVADDLMRPSWSPEYDVQIGLTPPSPLICFCLLLGDPPHLVGRHMCIAPFIGRLESN